MTAPRLEVYDALGTPASLTGGGLVCVDEQGIPTQADKPPVRLVGIDGQELEPELTAKPASADFTWNRDAPADWQARLDSMFPPNDRISWLRVVWVAADEVLGRGGRIRVEPVQRWVLFQMTRAIPGPVLHFLEGPPPHAKQNPIPLMREQWDLYQATRCYGQPYWILQGEQGGHKRRFNRFEQQILKAKRLPVDPPAAGALPYAPLDNRAIDKLAILDAVQNWTRAIELCERDADQLDHEERTAEEDGRRFLLTWLESQVDAAMDSLPRFEISTSREIAPIDADVEREQLITAPR